MTECGAVTRKNDGERASERGILAGEYDVRVERRFIANKSRPGGSRQSSHKTEPPKETTTTTSRYCQCRRRRRRTDDCGQSPPPDFPTAAPYIGASARRSRERAGRGPSLYLWPCRDIFIIINIAPRDSRDVRNEMPENEQKKKKRRKCTRYTFIKTTMIKCSRKHTRAPVRVHINIIITSNASIPVARCIHT